ncbi:GATOR1 complex protein NPRL3-like isoform X2 [Halichondria panicea]|uniref:GATOR1 complex protein NPRL3-like isoform X2 n=1 Tax=Halichondria panicea TaxID=6063 RepID=UPI00312B7B9E
MSVAVGLVTSGSRGNRLVFYHRGGTVTTHEDVASVLPPTTLAEILAPSSLMVDRKFELSVDQWRFVGHPFSVYNGTFSITFNVVFVLESHCSEKLIEAYDHLSHLIGSAIVHEEKKCDFLCQEVNLLMQLLEEADIPDPSASHLLDRSSLAKSLSSILLCFIQRNPTCILLYLNMISCHSAARVYSLQRGERHIQVKINGWSDVNMFIKFDSEAEYDLSDQVFFVRSYSALLLFESPDNVLTSLPPSSNPAMQRLLSVVSPLKNLQAVSLDADIPLVLVLRLASHLVHWRKAMAIYPLSENNVYITSPMADTRLNSELSSQFSDRFHDQCLADILSNFSLPVPLGDIKDIIDDETIVIWLLQHKQIVQLHTYVYIVPNEAEPPKINGNSPKKGDALKQSELLSHLTPVEKNCVLQTTAASNSDDLEEFARLSQYFHGNHHLEGIMLMENIPRSQLLTLIDKFSEILVTCTLPEHSIPSI